jgi:hypothetical protein
MMHKLALVMLILLALLAPVTPARAQTLPEMCEEKAPGSRDFAAWSGPWVAHGRYLDVYPEGCGSLHWRTYEWCPPGRAGFGGCDWVENGVIQSGGYAGFRLDVRAGAATSGRIVLTPDPALYQRPGIVLTLNPDSTLTVEWLDQPNVLCRPWAYIIERCGA